MTLLYCISREKIAYLAWIGFVYVCSCVLVQAADRDALGPIPPGIMDPLFSPTADEQQAPPTPRQQRPTRTIRQTEQPSNDSSGLRAREIQHHLAEAQTHDRAGRWRSALTEYQALIRLEPNNPSHRLRAAILATMVHQHNLADIYFTEIHEALGYLSPNHSLAWVEALLHLREFERADDVLHAALTTAPSHLRGRYYELILNQRHQRATAAEFWRDRNLAEQIRVAGWIINDETSLRTWLTEEGLRGLITTVLGDVSPANMRPVFDALRDAWTELERENWQDAITQLRTAQQRGASQPHITLEIARSFLNLDSHSTATLLTLSILEAHSHPPELAYPAAYILIGTEEYEQAAEILQAALDDGLEANQRIQMALAYALAGTGDTDKAWPIIAPMAEEFADDFRGWMERDAPHIRAIRADPRFSDLPSRSQPSLQINAR